MRARREFSDANGKAHQKGMKLIIKENETKRMHAQDFRFLIDVQEQRMKNNNSPDLPT